MHLAPMFIAVPLGAAFLVSLLAKKRRGLADILAAAAALTLCALSVHAVLLLKSAGIMVYKSGGWMPPLGIMLVIDGFSAFMLVCVNLIAALAVIYSVNYMEKFTDKWKYYTLFLLMLAGMNGVVITGDLFNLFVFLEIASLASYALVAFGTEQEELEASFKYMILGTLASAFILLGIAMLYGYTSTLNMADAGSRLAERLAGAPGHFPVPGIVLFIAVLFLMGFGLKTALVPFHSWLPDAHPSAPAPISAMLSGVLIKALGVYSMTRIFFNVLGMNREVSAALMLLGVVSMLVGVFLAVGQWDFKRLLAYHSISQIGYVVLGLGLATPLGILGGIFHLFNHAIFKSLLFFNSGAVDYTLKTRDLRQMGGLRRRMPVTANTSLIASLSISGIPPFNGFWSKLIIIIAAVQAGYTLYGLLAVIASILTLASFLKVQKYGFFSGETKPEHSQAREAPWGMRFAMLMLAVLCLGTSLALWPEIKNVFLDPAVESIMNGTGYAEQAMKAAQ